MSTGYERIAIPVALALIICGGVCSLKDKDDKTTAQMPANKVSFDKATGCQILDLEPGKKFVSYQIDQGEIFFTTRIRREDEIVEPEIMLMRATNTRSDILDCVYIVREHALPATSASK